MAAKRGSIAESTDNRIKLECVRRKNRRASITEQFVVPPTSGRRQEKRTQSRHHAFLLLPENASAIRAVVGRVRGLADGDAGELRGQSLSPMDRRRLHAWASDVLAVLAEFAPSESRSNDPLVRLLEQLQFLQDDHECLAEVAIDGRQLAETWERAGVFDDADEDDEDEDDEDDRGGAEGVLLLSPLQREVAWEAEKRRKIQASYAYQRVRERAAARVIKRNTLRWVRSRAAFCSRVEELEVFGNTTAALVEELMALSARQQRRAASHTSGIVDLMTGRHARPGGAAGRRQIGFAELMQFSRHLALFTVDHALRRVAELELKRRLYESRCAIKLQAWWRRMHEVVRGRRMLRLLADVKRKHEQEQAAAVAVAAMGARNKKAAKGGRKHSEAGAARRAARTPGKDKKSASGAGSSSRAVSAATSDASDASDRPLVSGSGDAKAAKAAAAVAARAAAVGVAVDAKQSLVPAPPLPPLPRASGGGSITGGGGATGKPPVASAAGGKKHSIGGAGGAKSDDRVDRISRAARAREARLRKEFEEELLRRQREDEEAARDTEDVEAAWRRFLESAQHGDGNGGGAGAGDATGETDEADNQGDRASTANAGDSESRGTTPATRGGAMPAEWSEWSDDDDDDDGHDGDDASWAARASQRSSRGSTPLSTASSRLSTPKTPALLSTRKPSSKDADKPAAPIKVVVTVKKRPTDKTVASENDEGVDGDASSPLPVGDAPLGFALPYATPPSPSRRQLLLGTSQARRSRPLVPGAGQLSRIVPFADFSGVDLRAARGPKTPPPRHLHDLDFGQPASLDLFRMEQPPLVDEADEANEPLADGFSGTSSRRVSTVRVFSSLRASRVARMRAALQDKAAPPAGAGERDRSRGEPPVTTTTSEDDHASELLVASTAPGGLVLTSKVGEVVPPTIRGRASMVAAYISNPMLKLDFRKEDLLRKPAETQEAEAATAVAVPETVATEVPPVASSSTSSTSATSPRARFGSHVEWLQSIGLGDAMALAARSSASPTRTTYRNVKARGPRGEERLATALIEIEQTQAQRARRRRKDEHALPLLGRNKDTTAKKAKAALESQLKPAVPAIESTLPPVAYSGDVAPTPSMRSRREPFQREVTAVRAVQDTRRGEDLPFTRHSTSSLTSSMEDSDDSEDASGSEETSESDVEENSASLDGGGSAHEVDGHESAKASDDGGGDDASDRDAEAADADPANAASTATARRASKKSPRRSVRVTRRRSLHEPRHAKESKSPKRKRRHRKPKRRESEDGGDNVAADADEQPKDAQNGDAPTAADSPAKKDSWRFRARVPSLLQRLVPKENRSSFDVSRFSEDSNAADPLAYAPCDDDALLDELGGGAARPRGGGYDDAEAGQQEAAKGEAFERLYTQYMGLLRAAPPLVPTT